jgi:hypothetical protein
VAAVVPVVPTIIPPITSSIAWLLLFGRELVDFGSKRHKSIVLLEKEENEVEEEEMRRQPKIKKKKKNVFQYIFILIKSCYFISSTKKKKKKNLQNHVVNNHPKINENSCQICISYYWNLLYITKQKEKEREMERTHLQ